MSVPENRKLLELTIQRSKERLYQYLPYINRTNGKPSWQWRFLEAAGKYKARIALGGNRIGKSDQGAYECWLAITGKHPYRKFPAKGKMWISALNYGFIRDVNIPKFESFMPENYRITSDFNKQDKIWWVQGEDREWKVQFKSADSGRRVYQGDDIDAIWFDEEHPEDVFKECMMRLVDRGGPWWMTATPILGTAWLKAKTEDERIFDTYGAMWDNPYLPAEEVQIASDELTEEERLVRIEGKYIIMGGKPVFDVLGLTRLVTELKDRTKHPLGISGTLTEAAA